MASVYVGTWDKYNNGSIEGAWIDLDKCATYADFVAKCGQIHKDEPDPEFMIQDYENFPDGLDCGDWLGEEAFNDIKTAQRLEFNVIDYSEKAIAVTGDTKQIADKLKAMGGRFNFRLSCGPGWIFPKSKESEVRAVLDGHEVSEESGSADYISHRDEWISGLKSQHDRDYYKKSKAGAIKLSDGYYVLSKPHIENRFCFHDEGPQYEFYKELHKSEKNMERYFMSENLSELDDMLKKLKEGREIVVQQGYDRLVYLEARSYYNEGDGRTLTDDERKQVIGLVEWVRAGFVKRLKSYLKRYGVSKIHTWTYWAEA